MKIFSYFKVHVVREKVTGNVYAMKVLRKSETLSQDNVSTMV